MPPTVVVQMTSLTEFAQFTKLPAELRFHIWELVPPPTRIVGLLPVADAGPNRRQPRLDVATRYQFRYVVQPREAALFAPLQACRESRQLWLERRVVPSPRCTTVPVPSNYNGGAGCSVEFCTSYLNYDTDIFTVFDSWRFIDFAGMAGYPQPRGFGPDEWADPFVGLDRHEIRQVGICEIPYGLVGTVETMQVGEMSGLRQLWFLTLGPGGEPEDGEPEGGDLEDDDEHTPQLGLEIRVQDLRDADCELRDVSADAVWSSALLNTSRLRHRYCMCPPIRPLPRYVTYIKALLTHTRRQSLRNDVWDRNVWDIMRYLVQDEEDEEEEDNSSSNTVCPLRAYTGCGPQCRDEVAEWDPDFSIGHKILYVKDHSRRILVEHGIIE